MSEQQGRSPEVDPVNASIGALWDRIGRGLLDLEDIACELKDVKSGDMAQGYYIEIRRVIAAIRKQAGSVLSTAEGVMEGRVRRLQFSGKGLPPDDEDDDGVPIRMDASELPKT